MMMHQHLPQDVRPVWDAIRDLHSPLRAFVRKLIDRPRVFFIRIVICFVGMGTSGLCHTLKSVLDKRTLFNGEEVELSCVDAAAIALTIGLSIRDVSQGS